MKADILAVWRTKKGGIRIGKVNPSVKEVIGFVPNAISEKTRTKLIHTLTKLSPEDREYFIPKVSNHTSVEYKMYVENPSNENIANLLNEAFYKGIRVEFLKILLKKWFCRK